MKPLSSLNLTNDGPGSTAFSNKENPGVCRMSIYPKNAWYVACWAKDLQEEKPTALTIMGEPLVLWRSKGEVSALEDRCVHRAAPLSLGRCEGAQLQCMYHGFLYAKDGTVEAIPGQKLIPKQAKARAYPVAERHSWVWVWMGDPAQADTKLIPAAIGLDDPDWILGSGQLDYDAEAHLIHANLLDFSHLTYVHPASFGSGSEFADDLPQWASIDRGMRHIRWIPGMAAPLGDRSVPGIVDFYLEYDFLVPGILLMWTGHFAQGTAVACEFGRPDYATAVSGVACSSQAVTPVDTGKARYFFSAGPHRLHGDEDRRDKDLAIALMAFGEDKVMIEAQQKILNRKPDHIVMPMAHDRAVTIFERLMSKLANENGQYQNASSRACGVPADS